MSPSRVTKYASRSTNETRRRCASSKAVVLFPAPPGPISPITKPRSVRPPPADLFVVEYAPVSIQFVEIHSGVQPGDLLRVPVEHERTAFEELTKPTLGGLTVGRCGNVGVHVGV